MREVTMFKRNVPGWERALRATCGITLLGVATALPMTSWSLWAVLAGGAGLVVSAAVGFCPACALAGRRPS
jgi:Ca2+/Na+ antiporter